MEANRGKDDVFGVIKELAEMLGAPELKSLRRAFDVWIKNLLIRYAPDSKMSEKVNNVTDIFEEYTEMETAFTDWADAARNEGEQKGKAELLVRQLSRRFGQLPKWAETRVNKAKSEQLGKWADAVLDASTLTEVIGEPKSSVRK